MHPLPLSGGPMYAVIFWATFALWMGLETFASRTKLSADKSKARDRGSLALILAMFWLALVLGFSLCYLLPQAAIRWNRVALFFAGIALMLAGIAFRWYAISVLGRFFTFDVAVHAGHTLVDTGPYRYIRHPSYTGGLITEIGMGLALGNWAALLAILGCMGIGYAYRISVEEAALVGTLGEAYKEYQRRTRRLVPFVF